MGVKSFRFLSSSSSENRDSVETNSGEATGKDEEFYEEIEAPKFVDFTSPDHYRPDDRYWFCQRVGCDLKHEEEMDSEEIYKKFVLRVMAARSPNIKLRKALDINSSRTPTKCPHSAPPKSSKSRLSRLEIISSLSHKMVDDKKRASKPHVKPASSTPVTKARPVAVKYLTTPRNKKCPPNTNSFRSVQSTKPTTIEVSKTRTVAKALVFHSPKKAIKLKTSIELRTPITRLCKEMSKPEISSQRKRALGYSIKSSKKLSTTEESLCFKTRIKHEKKSLSPSNNNTAIGKLSKPQVSKIVGIDQNESSITNEGDKDSKQEFMAKEIVDLRLEDAFVSSAEPQMLNNSDLAPPDDSKTNETCLHLEGSDDNKGNRRNEHNGNMQVTFESGECSTDHQNEDYNNQQNENSSYEGEKSKHEFDDKENAATSDENRMRNINQKKNGRKIFGDVKKILQAPDMHLKGSLSSSGPVMNFKKPKPTTLKPFRLRTDERGILREAKLERITNHLGPQNETEKLSRADDKLKVVSNVVGLSTPKALKKAYLSSRMTPQSHHSLTQQQSKSTNSPLGSNPIQGMDKIRKISSPLQKIVSTKMEIISYLIPGQKLDVIHEISPEISELRKARKPVEDHVEPLSDTSASRSSSRGKRLVTVVVEPKFHRTHVPRSCSKKVK